jgi:CHAT domain-containing protein/Tfp pilus assembly protein PilF
MLPQAREYESEGTVRRWRTWGVVLLGVAAGLGTAAAAEAQGRAAPASAAQLDEARALAREAVEHHRAGRYDDAILAAQRALAIFEKVRGPSHPDVAASLNNLAEMYEAKGEYGRAVPLLDRALAIDERALGPDHPDVATDLANLSSLYETTGDYGRAERLQRRALAIRDKALGPGHPDVAQSLARIAGLHQARGEYDRAEPLHRRALAILEKALGLDHPEVAHALDNLASVHKAKGEYDKAEPLYLRALAILEKALGPGHPDVVQTVNNLALLYKTKGDYTRAEPLYLRALAAREKALGPDHPGVAQSLNNLAALYMAKGEYGRAEPLYLRAMAIREKALGPEHPQVALTLDNLAALYTETGQDDRAEPLYRLALAIREKALGPAHTDVAFTLNNLGVLYASRGEIGRAEPLHQRAVAIREKALGPDHPDVAQSLDNLAAIRLARREYGLAEPLYRRALAIFERSLGAEHPHVATILNNLGAVYTAKGEIDRAEPLHRRALAIREKALGPDHPDVATSTDYLAGSYALKGDYARAQELHLRALAVRERTLGPDHPKVALSLTNLASLYWMMGRFSSAVESESRAEDVEERTLGLLVSRGSEKQDLIYVANVRGEGDSAIDLGVRAHEPHLAMTTILRRKGRALDALAGNVRALRARMGPEEQRLFDELGAARARYTALALRGPGATRLDVHRRDLDALRELIQEREAAVSERSAAYRAQRQPVTVGAVQAALPDGAALVEWMAYQPFHPGGRTENDRWAPARYAACVLTKRGAPACVDVGDLETLNAEVQTLRAALGHAASKDTPALARALEAHVMAPVRALLGDTRHVFLSPDGALNLVPFAALVGDDGRPLVERYAFTYLTGGRDLLRHTAHAAAREAPLVVTSPDFDLNAAGGPFKQLLRGAEVSAVIAARFQHPAPIALTGRDATKARLQQVHGPQFLHLGSHGYFDANVCTTAPPEALRDNPLLRSGIALAGANTCTTGHHDGLLTAAEASGLDLFGTKLAVLSACQTGTGDVKAGDGVYGLRRALVLAGAETQVMSLWDVDEAATAALMQAYYEALARGEGRSEAMRRVQRAMLHDGRHEHPYYWAAFIVSGDERTLDDKPASLDLRVHPGGACACRQGGDAQANDAPWLVVAMAAGVIRRRGRRGGA